MVALCTNGNHHNSEREKVVGERRELCSSKLLRLAIAQDVGAEFLGVG
jgi:hypothetical protein